MYPHVVVDCLLVWVSLSLAVPGELLVLGSHQLLLSGYNAKPRHCIYIKPAGKMQAKCAELHLEEIPKSLRTDVEILDLSVNRLRELTNQTFARHTSLVELYLMDNLIPASDEGAFAALTNLRVLDLRKNGISEFPKDIFHLESLEQLWLGANRLTDSSMRPTRAAEDSNLELLDISRNHLTSLPHLGILPHLRFLNVSGNGIRLLKREDVAMFCSLNILDISKNPLQTDDCSCVAFVKWINDRKIDLIPADFTCSIAASRCPHNSTSARDTQKLFASCEYVVQAHKDIKQARSTWIIVASSVSVFLVALVIALYCVHKRNKRNKRRKGLSNLKNVQLSLNHGTTELLKKESLTPTANDELLDKKAHDDA